MRDRMAQRRRASFPNALEGVRHTPPMAAISAKGNPQKNFNRTILAKPGSRSREPERRQAVAFTTNRSHGTSEEYICGTAGEFRLCQSRGADISARGRTGSSITELPPSAYLWVIGTALLGLLLGRIARLPAKWLMGPMLVSAAVHAFGLTEFRPPSEMVNLAQLIIGMTLGCRFAGVPAREILHTLMISVGSVVLLLGTALISAYLVSRITDESVISLILAYSPGGLAEMSLVALALHAEVAFVVAHHLVRVFAVLTLAQPIFRLLQHLSRNDRQH